MTEHLFTADNEAHKNNVIRIAKMWIGTPYQHQASCINAGCDCLGLIRGVWRSLYGNEPEMVPAYTPDWSEASGTELLKQAADRNLVAIDPKDSSLGDVLLFRMRSNCPAKHLGILSSNDHMIHAYTHHGVQESPLGISWRKRIAYAYSFPISK